MSKHYFVNGREVSKEDFKKHRFEEIGKAYDDFLKELSNMNYSTDLENKKECKSDKLKTTNLNIYEARTLLKNMPVGTKMKMYIKERDHEYIVQLDDYLNLVFVDSKNSILGFFDDDEILFATFDLIEEKKEEWVDCSIEEAVKKFDCRINDIRILDEKNEVKAVLKKETKLHEGFPKIYNAILEGYKWQYLKEEGDE